MNTLEEAWNAMSDVLVRSARNSKHLLTMEDTLSMHKIHYYLYNKRFRYMGCLELDGARYKLTGIHSKFNIIVELVDIGICHYF